MSNFTTLIKPLAQAAKKGIFLLALVLWFADISVAREGSNQEMLDKRVSLNVKNEKIGAVLQAISVLTGIKFMYSPELIRAERPVSLTARDEKLNSVLSQLLDPLDIRYEVANKQVLLTRKKTTPQTSSTETIAPGITTADPAGTGPAADRVVKGTVSDEKGEGLPGVSILVKGRQQGTTTDVEGKFSLNVPDDNAVLVFSYVGYLSQEVPVNNQSNLDVKLASDTKALDELVVVGYGTMKKSDLTGSVVRVNLEEKQNQPNVNLLQALSGAAPGVNIDGKGGAGAEPTFSIRGQTSLSANNTPLVVIDDIIYNGSLTDIDVNDVETIDVLKDASAVSVYGSRSANGVIIITTKKGKSDKPVITFNSYYGFQKMTNNPMRVMNGEEFATRLVDWNHQSAVYKWYATNPTSAENRPQRPDVTNRELVASYLLTQEEKDNYLAGREIDWVKAVLRSAAPMQNYNLGIQGKNGDKLNYFISGSYSSVDGIERNDQFKRLTLRSNLESQLNKWLKLSFNTAYSFTNTSGIADSLSDARVASPLVNNYIGQPNYDIYLGGELFQPYPLVYEYIDNSDKANQLQLTGRARIDVPWIKGLSYDFNYSNRFASANNNSYHNYNTPQGVSRKGMAIKEPVEDRDWILNNIVSYVRDFGKHNLNVTLLYTREGRNGSSSKLTAEGFENQALGYNAMALGTIARVNSGAWEESSTGLMARFNYSFLSRYILTGTIRRDGYSGFGANNKWGNFPSLSLAWVLSEEAGLKTLGNYYAKLRLSYGHNGNQGIGRYSSLSKIASTYYVYGQNTAVGLYPLTLGNSNLSWEKTASFNLGLDYGFLNNRITGAIELYSSATKDVLVERKLPPTAGYPKVWANLGGIRNKGIELLLNSRNLTGSLKWETAFTFSLNRSKITKLYGNGNDADVGNQWFVGEPISAVYDYKMTGGVWTEEEFFAGRIPYKGWYPGQFRYADLNGDNQITDQDRTVVGYKEPSYRFSISNTLSYGGFSLSIMINSIQGSDKYYIDNNASNINPRFYMSQRMNNSAINAYWRPDAPTTNTTGIYLVQPQESGIYQNRSFVRLQDVSLSYSLGKNALNTLRLSNCSFYVSSKNPYVWTNWQGWDPETGTSDTPMMRNYVAGVRFSF